MSDLLARAVATYDIALAETGSPAAGVVAAAVVLNLPLSDTLNALMAAGEVDFAFWSDADRLPSSGHSRHGFVRSGRVVS